MQATNHKQNLDDFRNICEKYQARRNTTVKSLWVESRRKSNSFEHADSDKIVGIAIRYNPQEDDILCTELIDRINETYVNSLKQEQGQVR